MDVPCFYAEAFLPGTSQFQLDEDSSKHAIQVLRLRKGDPVLLTDGKGHRISALIDASDKKNCIVSIQEVHYLPRTQARRAIGISLLKNAARFEWFLEKATELGMTHIYPLICRRTERIHFRTARLQQIIVSAMLQSQQAWIPEMSEPVPLEIFLRSSGTYDLKMIAHCDAGEKKRIEPVPAERSALVLIGPEGDFTTEEVQLSLREGFVAVSLGDTRLRTETAGVAAAVWMHGVS
jgi:16S rRNA (uracil1498-N3)-methyltransferase